MTLRLDLDSLVSSPKLYTMAETPRFTRLDADRILQRAAEIEGSSAGTPLTVSELRTIAGEAGFGTPAVERAIAEALQASPTGIQRGPVERSGLLVTRVSTVRTLPFELRSEALLRAVKLFHPYSDGPAKVSLEQRTLTWRDGKGMIFRVLSQGGETEISVGASRVVLRRGKWMGWVNAAADQLEAVLFLVATQDAGTSRTQLADPAVAVGS